MLKIIVTRMEILPGKAMHLVLERCCAVCELGSSGATCLLETKLQLSSQRQNLLCVVFSSRVLMLFRSMLTIYLEKNVLTEV